MSFDNEHDIFKRKRPPELSSDESCSTTQTLSQTNTDTSSNTCTSLQQNNNHTSSSEECVTTICNPNPTGPSVYLNNDTHDHPAQSLEFESSSLHSDHHASAQQHQDTSLHSNYDEDTVEIQPESDGVHDSTSSTNTIVVHNNEHVCDVSEDSSVLESISNEHDEHALDSTFVEYNKNFMRYYKGEGQMGPRGPQGPRGPPGPRGSTGSTIFNTINNEEVQKLGFFQIVNQGFCMQKLEDEETQPEVTINWDNDINKNEAVTTFVTINNENNLEFHEKGIYSIVFRFHFFLSDAPMVFTTDTGIYKHLIKQRFSIEVLKDTTVIYYEEFSIGGELRLRLLNIPFFFFVKKDTVISVNIKSVANNEPFKLLYLGAYDPLDSTNYLEGIEPENKPENSNISSVTDVLFFG